MLAAMDNEDSALHSSCVTMRAAGARLLRRAQDEGVARRDIDGADLVALAGSLAWLNIDRDARLHQACCAAYNTTGVDAIRSITDSWCLYRAGRAEARSTA